MSSPYRFTLFVKRLRSMSITWRRIKCYNLCTTSSCTSPFTVYEKLKMYLTWTSVCISVGFCIHCVSNEKDVCRRQFVNFGGLNHLARGCGWLFYERKPFFVYKNIYTYRNLGGRIGIGARSVTEKYRAPFAFHLCDDLAVAEAEQCRHA